MRSTTKPKRAERLSVGCLEEAAYVDLLRTTDLLPVRVRTKWLAEIQRDMPETPAARRHRFDQEYGISDYDAGVLTATRALGDYFEAVIRAGAPSKAAASWIQTELLRRLHDAGLSIEASPVTPAALAALLVLFTVPPD